MGQLMIAPTLRAASHADASSLTALALEVWLSTYIRHGINAHFADYALAHFTPDQFSGMDGRYAENAGRLYGCKR